MPPLIDHDNSLVLVSTPPFCFPTCSILISTAFARIPFVHFLSFSSIAGLFHFSLKSRLNFHVFHKWFNSLPDIFTLAIDFWRFKSFSCTFLSYQSILNTCFNFRSDGPSLPPKLATVREDCPPLSTNTRQMGDWTAIKSV